MREPCPVAPFFWLAAGSHVVNSSPYWRRLEVTIPGSKRGHVFIEATVGSGKGLIAVDDVTVMPGPCPNPALL